jgi:hypothetical protein
MPAGAVAGLLLFLPHLVGAANAETWKADMQLDTQRSAGLCLRGVENAYSLELAERTLTGRSVINSFRTRVGIDGTVRDEFVGELDLGLITAITTKMPRFTITGNVRTRELEMAWPSGPCTWKLKPRE